MEKELPIILKNDHGKLQAPDVVVANSIHYSSEEIDTPKFLSRASEHTGSFIEFSNFPRFLPVIPIGESNIPLYHFVEILDGAIAYADIQKHIPGISHSQIYGAMEFLRRISQYNASGIDIDHLENHSEFENSEVVADLRESLKEENRFVLTKSE